MIGFETPETIRQISARVERAAREWMRAQARHYDEHEGEMPWEYINHMHAEMKTFGGLSVVPAVDEEASEASLNYQRLAHIYEMLSWGDAGLYLCAPRGGLGAAAIQVAGTPEQKRKFLSRFERDQVVYTAMAITEAHAGSDTSAIRTRAVREGQEWVLNGEKIFVTGGQKALLDTEGFVVIWATIDPEAGRKGIRSFVVEAGTPGCTITKKEKKLGIRASDTVSIVLQDCRVPLENMLGSEDIGGTSKGYAAVLRTFDATRPLVASSALGIARAALEFLVEKLEGAGAQVRYGLPRSRLTNLEREVIDLEALWRSAWLLTLKAVWATDQGRRNTLEASMAKVRAGEAVVRITQRAIELLGFMGLSREHLLEKWFRDAKINDLYEGTGQINRLIVARQILGYNRHQLS